MWLQKLRIRSRDFSRPLWLLAVVLIYWGALFAAGGLKQDHFLVCGLALALFYWNERTRFFLSLLYPMILSGILYDSMRYYADYIRGPVHVNEPYYFDLRFFSLRGADGNLLTPNEWWQLHTNSIFDFACGLAYLIFIFEFIGLCIYFFFTQRFRHMLKAAWAFFWVNLAGYATYYIYAAAPPWYVALHGLGPARMDTPANPAGAARFDALLGTEFFVGMYGKAADVFGAVPSLHVSYPLLAMLYSFQIRRFRAFGVFFYILMVFSAVYLDHHYLLDVILGSLYAIATFVFTEHYFADKQISPPPHRA